MTKHLLSLAITVLTMTNCSLSVVRCWVMPLHVQKQWSGIFGVVPNARRLPHEVALDDVYRRAESAQQADVQDRHKAALCADISETLAVLAWNVCMDTPREHKGRNVRTVDQGPDQDDQSPKNLVNVSCCLTANATHNATYLVM